MPVTDILEKENIYRILFQSAAEGLVVVDRDGVIKLVNPRLIEMFGYTNEELLGQKVEMLIPQDLRKKHIKQRTAYNENPKKRSMGMDMDLKAVKKDGTSFPTEIALNHVRSGKELLVVALISDISERVKGKENLIKFNQELELRVDERTKELDRAIKALNFSNQELQEEIQIRNEAEKKMLIALEKEKELNELKSRFVSMASHEFRTPLSTVLTSVALISKYGNPKDEEKKNKHIGRIKSSVRNLTSILNDFLSLDKLETGNIEVYKSDFDVTKMAEDLVEEMQAIAKPNQKLVYEPKGEMKIIYLDQQILRSIIFNLISNAIKYSGEGMKIHLLSVIENNEVTFSVVDEGMGIPAEDQVHMFDRFFRAKNSLNIQGTGLGLNIVKRYVELLKGSVTFISKENEGTTFTVKFPINK